MYPAYKDYLPMDTLKRIIGSTGHTIAINGPITTWQFELMSSKN
jgi:hypothetical protein